MPPPEQQDGDHRPAHSVEHEGRSDDVESSRTPSNHRERCGPLAETSTAIAASSRMVITRSDRGRVSSEGRIAPAGHSTPVDRRTFLATIANFRTRRSSTSRSTAGARPGGRRRHRRPARWRSRTAGQERADEGVDHSRGSGALLDPADVQPDVGQPATSSSSGIGQTVSASGIVAFSASVRGWPSSTVKANRPPGTGLGELTEQPLLGREGEQRLQQEDDVERPGGTGGPRRPRTGRGGRRRGRTRCRWRWRSCRRRGRCSRAPT